MTPQTPYGWMIQSSTQVWFGEYAELDANAEAMRCGGTCTAFAIYIEPVAVPVNKRNPMTECEILHADPCPHEMFDQQRIAFARAVEAHHGITPQGDTP